MKHTHTVTDTQTIYTFENGTKLYANLTGGKGSLIHPATEGCGTFSFPIKSSGDVFHALRTNEPIPNHCKNY